MSEEKLVKMELENARLMGELSSIKQMLESISQAVGKISDVHDRVMRMEEREKSNKEKFLKQDKLGERVASNETSITTIKEDIIKIEKILKQQDLTMRDLVVKVAIGTVLTSGLIAVASKMFLG